MTILTLYLILASSAGQASAKPYVPQPPILTPCKTCFVVHRPHINPRGRK